MTDSFIQVPPDSTGKKIATTKREELYFSNLLQKFTPTDVVTGFISGATGIVTAINIDDSGTTGELFLKDTVGTWQNGEKLRVGGIDYADADITTTSSNVTREYQKVLIADPQNPEHVQRIDRFGATINTFTDGAPTFSPFGAMTVGERQTIKDYNFGYSSEDSKFYDNIVGGGTLAWEPNATTVLLSCGTASGDLIRRCSHFYHPYAPGIGQYIQMTARVGDEGKENVRRRWGYYDDKDGVFFELNGTALRLIIRSSVTGSVIDTPIEQADWNADTLDGTDSIDFKLDLSKPNIYWMDIQHLGTGRVRFGVSEPLGESVVAHIEGHANTTNVFPYMRSATLPVSWEQENTGVSGSTSEFRINCVSVKHSSNPTIVGSKHSHATPFITIAGDDVETPIFAVRPALAYNGVDNHGIIKFMSTALMNQPLTELVAGFPKTVIFKIKSTLSAAVIGGAWVDHSTGDSMAEVNSTLTSIAAGHTEAIIICAPGTAPFVQNNDERKYHSLELYNYSDNTTQPVFYVTAEMVGTSSASDTATVGGAINWEELLK